MHLHMVSMGWKWATLSSILEEGRAGLAFLHFTQCHSEVKKTNKQKNSGSTRSEGIMANIDVFTVRMTLNLLFKSGPDGWCKHSCAGPAWGALSMGLVTVQMPPPTNTALVLTTVLPCLQHQDLFARLYVEDVGVAGAVAHHQLTWVATHEVHWRWNTRLCRKHHVKTLILFAVCHYTSCSCLHY